MSRPPIKKSVGRIISGGTSSRATRTSLWQMNLPIWRSRGIESARLTGDVFITPRPFLRRAVRHTNRLTSLPGCHRFILRAGPRSWARQTFQLSPLAALDCYIESLRDTSCGLPMQALGSMVYWKPLPFYGVISFVLLGKDSTILAPTSRISILVWSLREDREAGKKKESHKAAQSRFSSREIES